MHVYSACSALVIVHGPCAIVQDIHEGRPKDGSALPKDPEEASGLLGMRPLYLQTVRTLMKIRWIIQGRQGTENDAVAVQAVSGAYSWLWGQF